MPLSPALGVRETVAGHRLGALEGGGGGSPPSHTSLDPPPVPPALSRTRKGRGGGIPCRMVGSRPDCRRAVPRRTGLGPFVEPKARSGTWPLVATIDMTAVLEAGRRWGFEVVEGAAYVADPPGTAHGGRVHGQPGFQLRGRGGGGGIQLRPTPPQKNGSIDAPYPRPRPLLPRLTPGPRR